MYEKDNPAESLEPLQSLTDDELGAIRGGAAAGLGAADMGGAADSGSEAGQTSNSGSDSGAAVVYRGGSEVAQGMGASST